MNESFFLLIGSDPPARIWSGVGDLQVPSDPISASPVTYLGMGQMLNAPDFQELINGVAERIEFTVSGVDHETVRLALEDAPTVKNATIYLGTMQFDEHWQALGSISWEATFRADSLSMSSQSNDQGRTRSITLSVGSDDVGRSRAPIAFFTDVDQRQRSSDDAIFNQVAGINTGTARRFGPSGA